MLFADIGSDIGGSLCFGLFIMGVLAVGLYQLTRDAAKKTGVVIVKTVEVAKKVATSEEAKEFGKGVVWGYLDATENNQSNQQ